MITIFSPAPVQDGVNLGASHVGTKSAGEAIGLHRDFFFADHLSG